MAPVASLDQKDTSVPSENRSEGETRKFEGSITERSCCQQQEITMTREEDRMNNSEPTSASAAAPEVDSRDALPVTQPMHKTSSTISHERMTFPEPPPAAAVTTTVKPRLTLSAFKRPEETVRLTESDPARRIEDYYDLFASNCGVLGHGAFATVRLAIQKQQHGRGVVKKVAVKSIAKHNALRSRRLSIGRRHYEEWDILRHYEQNPYIIDLLDVFETDEEIQLVLEYCRGGELFDAIQKKKKSSQHIRHQYSEEQASSIASQILQALADLHASDIVHRDVKPENILLMNEFDDDDNDHAPIHVKLGDFGMARALHREQQQQPEGDGGGETSPLTPGRTRAYSSLGSDYYVAPEVSYYGGDYEPASDVYSLGVTVYILLAGFPPVWNTSKHDTEQQVLFPHAYWKHVSDEAKELVRKMLCPDPSMRISAKEALQDPWIRRSCSSTNKRSSLLNQGSIGGPVTNLDLVRNRLYQLGAAMSKDDEEDDDKDAAVDKKRIFRPSAIAMTKKRRRMERRASGALMALADLYRGVARSSSAEEYAAGFQAKTDDASSPCDEKKPDNYALKALSV